MCYEPLTQLKNANHNIELKYLTTQPNFLGLVLR
jgi:hypothetical protein